MVSLQPSLSPHIFVVKETTGPSPDSPFLPFPMLSWKEIEEMRRYQVEIGAHTHTHPNLTELLQSEIEREVLTSKRTIEERTGNPCHLFAYPFGKVEERIKRLVASEFIIACSGRLNRVTSRSDLHSLERVDVGYAPHLSAFRVLVSRSFHLYLPIKRGYRKHDREISMKEMTILHLRNPTGWYGVEEIIATLAEGLKPKGFKNPHRLP